MISVISPLSEVLFAVADLHPDAALMRAGMWLAVFAASVAIGVVLVRRSGLLWRPKIGQTAKRRFAGEPEYRPSVRYQRYDEAVERRLEEEEMNRLLERISAKGLESLNRRERQRLKELAETRASR